MEVNHDYEIKSNENKSDAQRFICFYAAVRHLYDNAFSLDAFRIL